MRVLISNDDGVDAPGIRILAQRLAEVGEVTVVAPDRDRSGASNSLTLDQPIRALRMDNGYYRVAGTPTDCVHLALAGLLEQEPNIVVSGINNSANLGDDVIYSGTVAAAMEGRFLGLPAIAVSLASRDHRGQHYDTAARAALGLPDGELAVMRHARVDFHGAPAHVEWVYYPPDLAFESAIVFHDTGEGGVYARLAERGAVVDRYVEFIEARLPLPDEVPLLRIRSDMPVFEVTRLAWAGERVVEAGRAVLIGGLYQVVHETRLGKR